jgi:hypothetical protein
VHRSAPPRRAVLGHEGESTIKNKSPPCYVGTTTGRVIRRHGAFRQHGYRLIWVNAAYRPKPQSFNCLQAISIEVNASRRRGYHGGTAPLQLDCPRRMIVRAVLSPSF